MKVRRMQGGDATVVAALSAQLGYSVTPERIEERWSHMEGDKNNGLFVAEAAESHVVGWVHIYGVQLLESEPYAEIGGLVVDEGTRRCGVGRALMEAAEQWAQEQAFPAVRLRSGLPREEAHRFYKSIGYEHVKTSLLFCRHMNAVLDTNSQI